jgi:pimeloyl-ACP methyl ester carboxylesterase
MPCSEQPIVILGGFMSFSGFYASMRNALQVLTGQPTTVVDVQSLDWLPSLTLAGWRYLLDKLDARVQEATLSSPTGKSTLVGHSAGGVLARLYLSPCSFLGRTYSGLQLVDQLITLGSPHYNRQRWLHGGMLSRWVERRLPGARFSPAVQYISVAGQLTHGRCHGSFAERQAYRFYQAITREGNAWGDGLIPIQSALLQGARHIVLEGVGHSPGFGGPWYGSEQVVPRWWAASIDSPNQDASPAPP